VEVGLQNVLVIAPGGASPRPYKECDVFCVGGADFRLFRPVRENRRNWGVNGVKQGRAPKKF